MLAGLETGSKIGIGSWSGCVVLAEIGSGTGFVVGADIEIGSEEGLGSMVEIGVELCCANGNRHPAAVPGGPGYVRTGVELGP